MWRIDESDNNGLCGKRYEWKRLSLNIEWIHYVQDQNQRAYTQLQIHEFSRVRRNIS